MQGYCYCDLHLAYNFDSIVCSKQSRWLNEYCAFAEKTTSETEKFVSGTVVNLYDRTVLFGNIVRK